jgi:hypothetical protein
MAGIVSQSALKAGGIVHGIIPKALVSSANAEPVSKSSPEKDASGNVRSGEGGGEDVVNDGGDYEGRMTTEVVQSMHEVSFGVLHQWRSCWPSIPVQNTAETYSVKPRWLNYLPAVLSCFLEGMALLKRFVQQAYCADNGRQR